MLNKIKNKKILSYFLRYAAQGFYKGIILKCRVCLRFYFIKIKSVLANFGSQK